MDPVTSPLTGAATTAVSIGGTIATDNSGDPTWGVQPKADDFAVVVEPIAACAEHAARRRRLVAGCEGAWTPSLALTEASAHALSRRESEVAGLAARRLHNADIAARPFVSVRTVESHVQNAYGKLGSPAGRSSPTCSP